MKIYKNNQLSGISLYSVEQNGTLILKFHNGQLYKYKDSDVTRMMISLAISGKGLQTFINKNRAALRLVTI